MPRPRFATADAQLQRRILDAATEEFVAKGYEAASLNRILLAAGLSKGSFYYYFDDKADLATAVMLELIEALAPLFEELGKPATPKEYWAALRRYVERTMDEGLSSQQRLDLLGNLGMAFVDHPELLAHVMPHMAPFREQMVGFVKRGQKIGAVRTDLSAETLITVMQTAKTGLASALLPRRAPTRAELDKFNELYLDLVIRMVKP
jgi:AcrR family transcriptional regulator